MTSDRRDDLPDPVADLASAWAALTPPTRPEALGDQDAATRAAVSRLRASWDRVTPPATVVPPGLAARRRRDLRPVPLRVWRPLAAAALLAVVLAGPLLLAPDAPPRPAPDFDADTLAVVSPDTPPQTVAHSTPQVVRATADALELRSGPVRLLLLTPSESF